MPPWKRVCGRRSRRRKGRRLGLLLRLGLARNRGRFAFTREGLRRRAARGAGRARPAGVVMLVVFDLRERPLRFLAHARLGIVECMLERRDGTPFLNLAERPRRHRAHPPPARRRRAAAQVLDGALLLSSRRATKRPARVRATRRRPARRPVAARGALVPDLADARTEAIRTHSYRSPTRDDCGTATARSSPRMFVNSPTAHAALRRTLASPLSSDLDRVSTAASPIEASAIAACSPGEGCLKVSSAGLQLPLPQHLTGSTGASSPSIEASAGMSSRRACEGLAAARARALAADDRAVDVAPR